jgi:hypothetical protein
MFTIYHSYGKIKAYFFIPSLICLLLGLNYDLFTVQGQYFPFWGDGDGLDAGKQRSIEDNSLECQGRRGKPDLGQAD